MKFIYITMTQRAVGLLAGLSLIIVGVVVDTRTTMYLPLVMPPSSIGFNPVSISLQTFGALIFIVGFFGCCSASKPSFVAVVLFAVLLCLLLIAEITSITVIIVLRHQVFAYVKTVWLSSLQGSSQSNHLADAWDYIQQQFICCGVTNYTDWATITVQPPTVDYSHPGSNTTSTSFDQLRLVPDSCCIALHPVCNNALDDVTISRPLQQYYSVVHSQGCALAVVNWIQDNIVMIASVFAYLTVVQLIGIILTSSLARNIREECYQSTYASQSSLKEYS